MKFPHALVLAAALLPVAAAAQASSPAPDAAVTPNVPAAVTTRAKEWLHRLQNAQIDRSQLTAQMATLLTDAQARTLAEKIQPLGAPLAFFPTKVEQIQGNTSYVYEANFANDTTMYFIFSLEDKSGKISGLRLTPSE
jgi:hypothetical protein